MPDSLHDPQPDAPPGALETPAAQPSADPAGAFAEAVAIMARLRGPGGCPWDREQSFDSIRRHTLEECYEVLDAIERRDWSNLQDELGDLLLQVLFYAQMASEPGYFDITGVVRGLNSKLIRRHPHVFGQEASRLAGNRAAETLAGQVVDSGQVLLNWDAIKAAERRAAERDRPLPHDVAGSDTGAEGTPKTSQLESIPRSLPALMEAARLGSTAAKTGFDWPDRQGLFDKIEEEAEELQQALRDDEAGQAAPAERQTASSARPGPVAEELGDLLFTVVNLARHLKVDPEMALRDSNAKFRRRFAAMEAASSVPLDELRAPQLEELWAEAKQAERTA
ncbi:MAG TPA: nucleoside triphosphate pyrophosphohydrolase [Acidisarcina sp.]